MLAGGSVYKRLIASGERVAAFFHGSVLIQRNKGPVNGFGATKHAGIFNVPKGHFLPCREQNRLGFHKRRQLMSGRPEK